MSPVTRRLFLGAGVGAPTVSAMGGNYAFAASGLSRADLKRIQALLETYFGERALRVTAAGVRRRPEKLSLAGELAHTHSNDLSALDRRRSWLNRLHGGYRSARVRVIINRVQVSGRAVALDVTESTELFYTVTGSHGPTSTWYGASHRVTLYQRSGQMSLTSAAYASSDPLSTPVTQLGDPDGDPDADNPGSDPGEPGVRSGDGPASPEDIWKPGVFDDGSGSVTAPSRQAARHAAALAGYNYPAMASYARAWANGHNPQYPRYDDDCTNFTSQVMHAGGWAIIDGNFFERDDNNRWWHGDRDYTSSYTWGGAENFHRFALNSNRTYLLSSIWMLNTGDVLLYDYRYNGTGAKDHAQVCTGRDSTGPLMTQHDANYRDKRLTEIIASSQDNKNALKYAHRT